MFLFSVSEKHLGCGRSALRILTASQNSRFLQWFSAPHSPACCVEPCFLIFPVSASSYRSKLCTLMLCFQCGTVIGAFIFHFVSLVVPFTKRPAFYSHFYPLCLTLSIISRCFSGHVSVCKNQKLHHVGLYFNVEQHHLLRYTLGPGVAFPVQVTRKKYDLMKEEAFLKPSLKCRRVFTSAAAIVNITEPHGNVIMVPKSVPLGVWMRV